VCGGVCSGICLLTQDCPSDFLRLRFVLGRPSHRVNCMYFLIQLMGCALIVFFYFVFLLIRLFLLWLRWWGQCRQIRGWDRSFSSGISWISFVR